MMPLLPSPSSLHSSEYGMTWTRVDNYNLIRIRCEPNLFAMRPHTEGGFTVTQSQRSTLSQAQEMACTPTCNPTLDSLNFWHLQWGVTQDHLTISFDSWWLSWEGNLSRLDGPVFSVENPEKTSKTTLKANCVVGTTCKVLWPWDLSLFISVSVSFV